MIDDTAQPEAAETDDPNAQLENAAAAFLTATKPPVARQEDGRFAPKPQEETGEPLVSEPEQEPDYAADEDIETDDEDSEDAQPPAVEMPKSWSQEQAEVWSSLPPETQGYIAEREEQRDRAVNSKFQEFANARKEAEARLQEANTNRDKWAEEYDAFLSNIQLPKPDPMAFGLGTGNYDREGYDLAAYQYEQQAKVLDGYRQQRETIRAQQEAEDARQFDEWKQGHDALYAPKLVADVPDLQDPVKGVKVINDLIDFAVSAGIPEDTFKPENQKMITSAELHIIWKAKQYDALVANKGKPVAKQPSPALRPSVATPRSATQKASKARAFDRLAKTGSIEDAAAIFKTAFKG